MPSVSRPRAVAVTLLAGALVAALVPSLASARPERPAPVGSDPFRAGQPYRGDFPDPTVLRVGNKFYAYATTIAALSLPMSTSTNLATWTARPAAGAGSSNDAMPTPAVWARTKRTSGGRAFMPTWAPSVARLGQGRYVAAYSVPRASDGQRCISIARATHPMGPFVDRSTRPLTCQGPGEGVIDPQVFKNRGMLWLLHKVEGSPDRIVVRRLGPSARAFAPRSRNFPLLAPAQAWEGSVVENPAMIRFRNRLYLFYSGHGYGSSKYATGYATCRSVTGPCTRQGRLLASGTYVSGPGGATPFLDRSGRLRLAYAAWRTGNVGYPTNEGCLGTAAGCAQRRMYIAILGPAAGGKLVVRRKF